MNITMTVGGRDCHPNVLKNEVTCRVPRDVDLSPAGAPVQVGTPRGTPTPLFLALLIPCSPRSV